MLDESKIEAVAMDSLLVLVVLVSWCCGCVFLPAKICRQSKHAVNLVDHGQKFLFRELVDKKGSANHACFFDRKLKHLFTAIRSLLIISTELTTYENRVWSWRIESIHQMKEEEISTHLASCTSRGGSQATRT